MDLIGQFQKYAEAFEKTYATDDWSWIEPFFAEDAVYEVVGIPAMPIRAEGRPAVLEALKKSVDSFDRRCESRALEVLEPPSLIERTVTIRWAGTYTLEGAPDLVFEGVEEAHYNENGAISHLVDSYEEKAARRVGEWMASHFRKES